MKRKVLKWVGLAAILILVAVYFFPDSMVSDTDNCDIVSIMYRADGWETLRYFPPQEKVSSVDEGELLALLERSKVVRELLPGTAIDGIPSEEVTLMITLNEGTAIKYVLLGDLNSVRVQGKSTRYKVLDPASVLSEALNILGIDADIDSSALQPAE